MSKRNPTDPGQMRRGIEHEMEHTDDPAVAAAIACDHLEEIPDYYDRLDKMEGRFKRGLAPNTYAFDLEEVLLPQIDKQIEEGGGWANMKRLPGGQEAIWELIDRGILEEDGGFVRRRREQGGEAVRAAREAATQRAQAVKEELEENTGPYKFIEEEDIAEMTREQRFHHATAFAKLLKKAGTPVENALPRVVERFHLTDTQTRSLLWSVWHKKSVTPNRSAAALRGSAMETNFGEEVDPDPYTGREGSDLDDAMKRYQTFHAKAPIKVSELDHDLPQEWVCVGESLAVMYRTDKWHKDGDDEDYKHLHDSGEDKEYVFGQGVRFYEPASEWSRSSIAGKRRHGRAPRRERLPVREPQTLTLLGYCLGAFVRLYPEDNVALSKRDRERAEELIRNAEHGEQAALEELETLSVFETNPRGAWLFCSPSGDMLAIYSPYKQPDGSSGFLAATAGGKLRVLKDGIDG